MDKKTMDELAAFTLHNQVIVDTALAGSLSTEERDQLEVLQSSLHANGLLIRLYLDNPKRFLKLVNKL